MSRRPFILALRRAGFAKTLDSRAGGCRVAIFEKQVDERRRIYVQLWGDGRHRASHGIGGRETTRPTRFTTIDGMHAAIQCETLRTDNLALTDETYRYRRALERITAKPECGCLPCTGECQIGGEVERLEHVLDIAEEALRA